MNDCPPDRPRSPLGRTDLDAEGELATLAKALGHPARVRILRLLLQKSTCVAGELSDELPLAASTVSQHLQHLKRAGLIKGEVDGPRRCYCIDRVALEQLKTLVADL